MEIQNIYIPIDIIDIIYKKIPKLKDKENFYKVNKSFYENYHEKTKMYYLEVYLNVDYLKFYNLLNKYDYEKVDIEYLKRICFESIKYLNLYKYIYLDNIRGFGDYRFIFELLFKYDIINSYMIEQNSPHFHTHFYPFLEKSIVKNNRKKTIENINNSDMLFSLKRKFIPKSEKNKTQWIHLFE